MRKRIIWQLAITMLVSISAKVVDAKSVLWYRLDGLETGVTSTPTTVIENIADPGKYQLLCHSLVGIDRGTVPEHMPYGTNGLPAGLWVYDPITGIGSERLNSMHFGLTEIPEGLKEANGSMLRTHESPSNIGLTNLTVEAVFRVADGDLASWSMAPIAYQHGNSWNDESYALQIGWDGKLACRFNADNSSIALVGPLVKPGIWHHAAFTLDAEGTARLYLNYNLVGIYENCGALTQYSGRAFMIGANTHRANRTFPGDIIEVRVSDTALDSREFLQVRYEPRETPADTICFLPDVMGTQHIFGSLINLNAATGSLAYVVSQVSETNSPLVVVDASEKAGAAFRFGVNDKSGTVANQGSTRFLRQDANTGSGLKLNLSGTTLEQDSFTLECFFKTTDLISDETWTLFYSPCVKVCIGDDGKILGRGFRTYNDWGSVSDIKSRDRVDDGNWHHLAFVYNNSAGRMRLYMDYQLQGSVNIKLGTTGTISPTIGMQNVDGNRQHFPGWLDEVRITRQALGPDGFLLADPVGPDGVLVHITFDGSDYAVAPYPSLCPAGTGVPHVIDDSSGNSPLFNDKRKPKISLDGQASNSFKQNIKSLFMDSSQVRFPYFANLHGKNTFTIEWFMNLSYCDPGVGILRLNQNTTTFEGRDPLPMWMVFVSPSNKRHLQFQACSSEQKYIYNWQTLPVDIDDGRWHHYAVTVEEIEVSGITKTELNLYFDYVNYGSQQFTGTLQYPENDACSFTICANDNFTGYLDEIRISEGVLPISSFMYSIPVGTLISVR